jgi:hypothetical protein
MMPEEVTFALSGAVELCNRLLTSAPKSGVNLVDDTIDAMITN